MKINIPEPDANGKYDFDAVAAAINDAGYGYESYNGYKVYAAVIRKPFTKPRFEIDYKIWIDYDDTPTAALVAACVKYNEEAE